MKKRSNQYWVERADKALAEAHKNSDKYIANINIAYDKAVKDIKRDIDTIFVTYANNHKLTAIQAKELLNSKITPKEIEHLRKQVEQISNVELKKSLLAQLNANAYKARITRLEALKQSVSVHCKALADKEITLSSRAYADTIKSSYYKHIYDIQKGLDLGFNVAQLPTKTIEFILSHPWTDKHFSERVWKNTDILANKLTETITGGMISGKSIRKMAKELEELSEYGKHAAERLVRTETTYFCNQASMESYKECGIEKYVFVATLDLRTSDICRKHDRKVYEVSKGIPGENLPPLHTWCRSTTRAYLGEKYMENIKRRARDPETGRTYIVGNMSYNDRYDKYVSSGMEHQQDVKISKKKEHNTYSVNRKLVNSKAYHDKFQMIPANKHIKESLYYKSKEMLEHRDGTEFEDLIILDLRSGQEVVANRLASSNLKTGLTKEQYELVNSWKNDVVILHNHPGGGRPSVTDLITLYKQNNAKMSVVAGHDGSLHYVYNMNRKVDIEALYNDWYNEYIKIYSNHDIAKIKATNKLYSSGLFEYKEV